MKTITLGLEDLDGHAITGWDQTIECDDVEEAKTDYFFYLLQSEAFSESEDGQLLYEGDEVRIYVTEYN